jgi:molybdopterin synthase catalytic subunit
MVVLIYEPIRLDSWLKPPLVVLGSSPADPSQPPTTKDPNTLESPSVPGRTVKGSVVLGSSPADPSQPATTIDPNTLESPSVPGRTVKGSVVLGSSPADPSQPPTTKDPNTFECSNGGLVIFQGIVRGRTGDVETEYLEYSAHTEMALRQMREIENEARRKFGAEVVMVHRLGRLSPGDTAVLVAAATPHRSEAFEACRFLIDTLKQDVPIWKKEFTRSGAFWVEGDRQVAAE